MLKSEGRVGQQMKTDTRIWAEICKTWYLLIKGVTKGGERRWHCYRLQQEKARAQMVQEFETRRLCRRSL